MDDVARLPPGDRADLFRAAAASRGLTAAIIEKDFWVCWTLRRVFNLADPPAGLLFKGGTSLSKVFQVIDRFSEDVDLSFDRAGLGFAGEKDPQRAATGKGRRRGLEALADACRRVTREQFLPQLRQAFTEALAGTPDQAWSLELIEDEPDGPTLLFTYPQNRPAPAASEPPYISPTVRLELGARSDHWPAVMATVTPYAAIDFPGPFKDPRSQVKTLAAERTFWEKATILHAWCHAPADKAFRDRQSRHYYDLVRLYEHESGKAAIKNIELLLKVAEHKRTFFAASWARYADAKPGTLRLVPPENRLPMLEQDYRKMHEMFFGEPPPFEQLIDVLRQIEREING